MTDNTEQKNLALADQPKEQNALALIYAAATNKDVDPEKMRVLADLHNSMQDREAERRFRMAKHQALTEMPSISKKGAILNKSGQVQSRYSKWEDIHAVIKPILDRNNLILSFNIGHEGQMVTVQPILSYSDGELAFEERGGDMVLAIDTTGSKNATQGAGSAASYGKRHSAKAMLNIVEEAEDDDGRGGKTSYENLPEAEKGWIDDARRAALNGADAYEEHFKGLDPEQRGFLAFNRNDDGETWHTQNKRNAAAVGGAQ